MMEGLLEDKEDDRLGSTHTIGAEAFDSGGVIMEEGFEEDGRPSE